MQRELCSADYATWQKFPRAVKLEASHRQILSCTATSCKLLWRQVGAMDVRLLIFAAADLIPEAIVPPLTACHLLNSSTRLLNDALHLLSRLHVRCLGSDADEINGIVDTMYSMRADVELVAVSALLTLLSRGWQLASMTADDVYADDQEEASCCIPCSTRELDIARPCAILAAVMRCTRACIDRATVVDVAKNGVMASLNLFHWAIADQADGGSIAADACKAVLLPQVCSIIVVQQSRNLARILAETLLHAAQADNHSEADQRLPMAELLLAASPAVCRALLAAVLFIDAEGPHVTYDMLTTSGVLLSACATCLTAARYPDSLTEAHVTAEHVNELWRCLQEGGDAASACNIAAVLFQHGASGGERSRMFMFAAKLVDEVLTKRVGDLPADQAAFIVQRALHLVEVLMLQGTSTQSSQALRPRARWLVQHGVLPKAEAVLRRVWRECCNAASASASSSSSSSNGSRYLGRRPSSDEAAAIGREGLKLLCKVAVQIWCALRGDTAVWQAIAMRQLCSVVATARKALCIAARSAAVAAMPSVPPAAATAAVAAEAAPSVPPAVGSAAASATDATTVVAAPCAAACAAAASTAGAATTAAAAAPVVLPAAAAPSGTVGVAGVEVSSTSAPAPCAVDAHTASDSSPIPSQQDPVQLSCHINKVIAPLREDECKRGNEPSTCFTPTTPRASSLLSPSASSASANPVCPTASASSAPCDPLCNSLLPALGDLLQAALICGPHAAVLQRCVALQLVPPALHVVRSLMHLNRLTVVQGTRALTTLAMWGVAWQDLYDMPTCVVPHETLLALLQFLLASGTAGGTDGQGTGSPAAPACSSSSSGCGVSLTRVSASTNTVHHDLAGRGSSSSSTGGGGSSCDVTTASLVLDDSTRAHRLQALIAFVALYSDTPAAVNLQLLRRLQELSLMEVLRAECEAWLHQPELAARVLPMVSQEDEDTLSPPMAGSCPTTALAVLRSFLDMLDDVQADVVALPAVAADAQPRWQSSTWDSCAMACSSPGDAVPSFGCWCRGCTNLEGGSEAELPLSTCSGCGVARYCSPACQRRAWRAGHRAACLDWQAANKQHAEAAEGEQQG